MKKKSYAEIVLLVEEYAGKDKARYARVISAIFKEGMNSFTAQSGFTCGNLRMSEEEKKEILRFAVFSTMKDMTTPDFDVIERCVSWFAGSTRVAVRDLQEKILKEWAEGNTRSSGEHQALPEPDRKLLSTLENVFRSHGYEARRDQVSHYYNLFRGKKLTGGQISDWIAGDIGHLPRPGTPSFQDLCRAQGRVSV